MFTGKLLKSSALILCCIFFSCTSRNIFESFKKKYSAGQLNYDYSILQSVLEKKHPSLYWYTNYDSIQYYFRYYKDCIKDSMNEQEFTWKILHPLLNKIRCGHTEINNSKSYEKRAKKLSEKEFPLFIKVWNDTAVVIQSLYQNDSIFKRGTIIKAINGVSAREMIQKMKQYFSQDGNAEGATYLKISFNFPYYYKNIFGLIDQNTIEYFDDSGFEKKAMLSDVSPDKFAASKSDIKASKTNNKKSRARLQQYRSFEIDSSNIFAVMRLNTFSKGRLRKYFRQSFKKLKDNQIPSLILDIRLNGGGKVSNSTLLTKYLSRHPFKLADTAYSITKSLHPFNQYFKSSILTNIALKFIAQKKKDDNYHLTTFEKKWYQPKKRLHYDGKVYLLTSGMTFSASCLLANTLKGQQGITLLGEETGGGWYGNSGILIPTITLPITKTRISVPLFRIVQHEHPSMKGSGILPDVLINTSYEAIKKGFDKKLTVVKMMIADTTNFRKIHHQ